MCESKARGGQRCISYTRPKYEASISIVKNVLRNGNTPSVRDEENLRRSATAHASTADIGALWVIDGDIRSLHDDTPNPFFKNYQAVESIRSILKRAIGDGREMRRVSDEIRTRVMQAEYVAEQKRLATETEAEQKRLDEEAGERLHRSEKAEIGRAAATMNEALADGSGH